MVELYEASLSSLGLEAKYVYAQEIKHIKTETPLEKRQRLAAFVRGLQILKFLRPHRGFLLAAMYLWFRHLDDVIDGDRTYNGSIADFLQEKYRLVQAFDQVGCRRLVECDEVDCLLIYSHRAGLEYGFNLAPYISDIFSTIVFDYERAQQPQPLAQEKIDWYFSTLDNATVEAVLLIIGETGLTLSDLAGLNQAVRCHYNIRDLQEDIVRNIVNISQEDLRTFEIDLEKCRKAGSLSEMLRHYPLMQWRNRQIMIMQEGLKHYRQAIAGKRYKWITRLILYAAFIKPRLKFLQQELSYIPL